MIVELMVACVYVLLWSMFDTTPFLFALYAVLTAVLAVITVYDMRHTIIPDEFVMGVLACAFLYLGYMHMATPSVATVLWSVAGGLFGFIFFAAFWYVSHGRWMGLGDAKLAFPLGMMVGFPAVYTMIVIAFVVGAVVSVCLLLVQRFLVRGKTALLYFGSALTIKSEIPFAPFLIIGFLFTHFFHADIFEITRTFLPF
jgi:prepilin signal peptidase PulO-like enzyme (type II secretory pathway)